MSHAETSPSTICSPVSEIPAVETYPTLRGASRLSNFLLTWSPSRRSTIVAMAEAIAASDETSERQMDALRSCVRSQAFPATTTPKTRRSR
jgi:hypothetical protein